MKDNFSTQSSEYARFRPVYTEEVIDYVVSLAIGRQVCWDCGTGNGQLASKLADHFEQVYATDISEKQLANAIRKPNIFYSNQPAETTNFAGNQFDLITVAQAVHWFDFDRFFNEVERVLKPNGVLVLLGYGLLRINPEVDRIIDELYRDIIGEYWDQERDHIEQRYMSIPFPLVEEKNVPVLALKSEITLDHLVGYLRTWSAVQHFIRERGYDPVNEIEAKLQKVWPSKSVISDTPFFMRVGRLN